MAEQVKIEIGFEGGNALIITVEVSAVDELERAMGGDGSVSLDASDGRYTVSLKRVAYVRRFARASRVGFGAG
jgi:hypothetical protein